MCVHTKFQVLRWKDFTFFFLFFLVGLFSQTSIGRYVAQMTKGFVVLIFGYKTGNFHPKTHTLEI